MKHAFWSPLTLTGVLLAAGTVFAQSVPPVTEAAAQVGTEVVSVEAVEAPGTVSSLPNAQPQVQGAFTEQGEGVLSPAGAVTPEPDMAGAVSAASALQPQQPAAPSEDAVQKNTPRVEYNPPTDRDPTLSPDDTLLLRHREEERLRALEAERQRKLDEERRRLEELERQRQWELELLRDPSRLIRGRIRVNGIIGQEAFIGNKIYSVGDSVLGARIVEVRPDAVVFVYKGQRFTRPVELK